MTFAKTSICVNYTFAENWHVFTSDDLPGLMVAHKDSAKAFLSISESIEKLLLLNEGLEYKVDPEPTLEMFLEETKGKKHTEEPLMLSSTRFSIVREMEYA